MERNLRRVKHPISEIGFAGHSGVGREKGAEEEVGWINEEKLDVSVRRFVLLPSRLHNC